MNFDVEIYPETMWTKLEYAKITTIPRISIKYSSYNVPMKRIDERIHLMSQAPGGPHWDIEFGIFKLGKLHAKVAKFTDVA